jgi:predicted DNA binding CopG/RHH family protein
MAKRGLKPIPEFRSEAAERRFWETHDTTKYVNWSKAFEGSFPDLKPTTTTISLRLPSGLLSELKILANKQDVPYQSLLKVLLAESVAKRRHRVVGRSEALETSRVRQRASRV